MLLTIVLTNAGGTLDFSPVTGAPINAEIDASGAHLVVPVPPEAKRASSGYYETTVNVPGEGDAKVSLEIRGPRGDATGSFTLKRPASWVGWVTLGGEVLFAGVVLTCTLIFTANSLCAGQKPAP